MLIALQATIHHSDVATATATFAFIVLLGATLGIAIGGTVFQNTMTQLSTDLPPESAVQFSGTTAGAAVGEIQGLPEPIKGIVVGNYAASLRMVWVVLSCFAGAGLIGSAFIGTHELHRE
jgi:hypothetical protein